MSIEALSVVLHHSRAKHSAKLVLVGIANHYHPDDDRGAWPSQETLARYANITDRGVRKCIEQLVELGELRVETHGGPTKGSYKPNRYWITLECPEDCDRSMNHRPKQPELFDRATGTFGQSNRNYLTEQPEPQFRRTVIEPKERTLKNLKANMTADDYEPSNKITETFEADWPGLRLEVELAKFRDNHMAKGSKFKDWDRAFRTWLRNASEWSREARIARANTITDDEWEAWKKEKGYE
jgi:hypothetical protein